MPTLIVHVDKITPKAGYMQKQTQTEPFVVLKLRKPHMMIMKKDVGEFKTEAKADEVYETKHSFEVDSLQGLELHVEVFDEKLAEHTVNASVTGAKALGDTSKLLLGSCLINLDKHGISDDPKGVKCPLSNTFTKEGKPEILLIFTLNP